VAVEHTTASLHVIGAGTEVGIGAGTRDLVSQLEDRVWGSAPSPAGLEEWIMRTSIKRLVGSALVALTVGACSAGATEPTGPSPTPSAPVAEALVADVDIGGRTLHLVCVGPTDTGRPTVIFENGLGGDFRSWGDVLGELKATDRGCSYDRAGVGMSPPADAPRTTRDQVADLRSALAQAGIAPPYVLVGYSLGGWNTMVFAADHPDEVAGAVLVDARPPEASRRWLAALPPETPGESEAIHQNRAEFTTFEDDPSLNPEGLDLAASSAEAAEVLQPGGLGDRPLAVIVARDTSGLWEGLDADLAATLDGILRELQAELAAWSTDSTTTSVDAPHEIPAEQPGAVVDAIREVLAGAGD
jgi:pimeloyl-ACP methyl ester carboxylesterase